MFALIGTGKKSGRPKGGVCKANMLTTQKHVLIERLHLENQIQANRQNPEYTGRRKPVLILVKTSEITMRIKGSKWNPEDTGRRKPVLTLVKTSERLNIYLFNMLGSAFFTKSR